MTSYHRFAQLCHLLGALWNEYRVAAVTRVSGCSCGCRELYVRDTARRLQRIRVLINTVNDRLADACTDDDLL